MLRRYIFAPALRYLPVIDTDILVIGTGIAGLYTALKTSAYARVLVVSKTTLQESNTNHAQGGIAAAIAEGDSPELHRNDTLAAGAGLNSVSAVEALVEESPAAIEDLIRMGTQFDTDNDEIALTREAAHSRRRILHAQGDATGSEIVRALSTKVLNTESIEVLANTFAIDLVTHNGECTGAVVLHPNRTLSRIVAKATVLATGGAGMLFRYTTNPEVATADGVAMAYRAGAAIQDLEFVQFHPTALCYPGAPRFLLSEALRGEGAVLRNTKGECFMSLYHADAELAPRDIVARAIVSEMEKTRSTFVYLDITHKSSGEIKQRFPNIYQYCLTHGLDLTTDWIPVAPAAHYMMGGVQTSLRGETTLPRLYACGEVSCTGLHGANRLASNSLSDGVVFGRRIAEDVRRWMESPLPNSVGTSSAKVDQDLHGANQSQRTGRQSVSLGILRHDPNSLASKRLHLQKVMLRYVGLKRSKETLLRALAELGRQAPALQEAHYQPQEFEFVNLLTCAILLTQAALHRQESRGSHFRSDYPERNDKCHAKHIVFQKDAGLVEEDLG